MKRWWQRFLAFWRFDLELVCELSKGKTMYNDYHDYHDSEEGEPWHFGFLTCKRCGKRFII